MPTGHRMPVRQGRRLDQVGARRLRGQRVDGEAELRGHHLVARACEGLAQQHQELVRAIAQHDLRRRDTVVGGKRPAQRSAERIGIAVGQVQRRDGGGAGGGAGAQRVFVRAKLHPAGVRLAQRDQVQARIVGPQALHARPGERGEGRLVHAQSSATG